MKKMLGVVALSTLLMGCSAQPVVMEAPKELDTVSVSGKAEVKVVPDKASIGTGVRFTAETAEEANILLTEKMSTITNALKGAGITDKDISTDYYSVDPDYRWLEDERVLRGYSAQAELTVTGVDIDNITEVINVVMGAGADSVGSIQYYSSEYKESYDEALNTALSEARSKADSMGESAGFKVVRVHSIDEGYQNTQARYVTNAVKDMVAESAGAGAVSPGEISINAQVSVTYVIE